MKYKAFNVVQWSRCDTTLYIAHPKMQNVRNPLRSLGQINWQALIRCLDGY